MSKKLVAFFSASGTTKKVAEMIAEEAKADLFEIEPKVPYTKADLDWMDKKSRSSVEMRDKKYRPEIMEKEKNMSSYDEILLVFPIWWGIAAWPVDGFIEANDFTGKAVIPFCTAASSGIGDSGNLLEEMAGTGNWLEGKRLDRGISEDEVKDWINDLGISSAEN